jgi:hypothetical protein
MFDNRGVANASLGALSDADLVRMHADGHKEALGVVCDRHGPRLMAVAAKIAGQDASAGRLPQGLHEQRSVQG